MTTGEGIFLAAMIASAEWSEYHKPGTIKEGIWLFSLVFFAVLLRGIFRGMKP